MNNLNAWRISTMESGLIKGQQIAAEMENIMQLISERRHIDPFFAPIPRLISMATSYETVAKRIRDIAIELKETEHENERHLPEQVSES